MYRERKKKKLIQGVGAEKLQGICKLVIRTPLWVRKIFGPCALCNTASQSAYGC